MSVRLLRKILILCVCITAACACTVLTGCSILAPLPELFGDGFHQENSQKNSREEARKDSQEASLEESYIAVITSEDPSGADSGITDEAQWEDAGGATGTTGAADAEATDSLEATDKSAGEDSPEDSSNNSNINADEDDTITLVFAGDVLFQSNITAAYDSGGLSGILSPDLQQSMAEADLTVVNEEFPFGTGGEPAEDKQYTFRVEPSYVRVLNEMGVDLVSLSNNHVLDYGQSVLSETFTVLDNAGITYAGAGESLERAKAWQTFELKGRRIGILCASRVIPVVSWDVKNSQPGVFTTYDESLLVEQIRASEQVNDFTIVYVHWGIEKAEYPEDYQRQLAKAYIDAGADLVIGAHPHVLQGIEYYKGVPIVYSLGNFMFHASINRTILLKATLSGGLTLTVIPAAASNSQTYALEGDKAQELLDYLESISFGVVLDANGTVRAE